MDLIPQDVWPLIASFLDDKTKRLMRLASIKWFNIIKYNNFNLYFTRKENISAIADRLSKYSWPIKLTFKKPKLDLTDIIDHLHKLTNSVHLKLNAYLDSEHVTLEQWMQLSALTNLEVLGFGTAPLELWKKLPNITSWHRVTSEEKLAPVLKRMSNLRELFVVDVTTTWPFALVPNPEKLTSIFMSAQQTLSAGEETWSRLTNLKVFDYYEDAPNSLKLEYLTSLEDLSIISDHSAIPSVAKNTNLTILRVTCQQCSRQNIESISGLKKLQELILHIPAESDYPLHFQFLAHLTQLTTLEIEDVYSAQANLANILLPHVPQSLRKLTSYINSDVDLLTHLTNLVDVDLSCQRSNTENLTKLSNIKRLRLNELNNDFRSVQNLTSLQELYLDSRVPVDDEIDMPDLSQLWYLTRLQWGLQNYPMKKLMQMQSLTNLQQLTIGHNRQVSMENCDFLGGLINLTNLTIKCGILNEDSFWQNISGLTNLNLISIDAVDYDDRLLLLTSLTRLTSLEIANTPAKAMFTGVHFTALTSLQAIHIRGDGSNLVHNKDITKSMPYLISYTRK